MRDLRRDLEICNQATPGPWEWQENKWWGGHSGMTGKGDVSVLYPNHANDGDDGAAWFDDWENDNDRIFIAQAREGWPHAIERAIKAEAENSMLRKVVDAARALVPSEMYQYTHHLFDLKRTLDEYQIWKEGQE